MLLLPSLCFSAQKKWIGGSGNWNDVVNWLPATLPDSSDQVMLDNSVQTGDYTVTLPDHAVTVNTLTISPATGRQIELYLPASNGSSPAFAANTPGDGIIIKNGGIFRNASGLSSGSSLQLNGQLRIENGGTYIHNTRSGHAADVVAKLSVAAGTEHGRFRFDVPGGAYPVSLSNRVYGDLMFSSAASGGTQTYNAAGTNPLLVRGDLTLQDGVVLNIDFTKDFTVAGTFRQEGGVFNVASQPNSSVVRLQGDVWQSASGIITETSTGLPVIEFSGNARQQLSLQGSIANQVVLRVNNVNGVQLQQELTIPYELQLQQGPLVSSLPACVVISRGGKISGASAASFIQGPVKKRGEEAFSFPVGKQHDYAPVAISAGTSGSDEFVAEYFLDNPQLRFGPAFDRSSLVRISALEYWKLEQTTGRSVRKVSLSVGLYSQATALDKLVVSRWNELQTTWNNSGNTGYTGIATGQITGSGIGEYGAFTLASTVPEQNPLPLAPVAGFDVTCNRQQCRLYWQATGEFAGRFQIERSADRQHFTPFASLSSTPGERSYQLMLPASSIAPWFRLKWMDVSGRMDSSTARAPAMKASPFMLKQAGGAGREMRISVVSEQRQSLQISILAMDGRLVYVGRQEVQQGLNMLNCPISLQAKGVYIVWVADAVGQREVMKYCLQ